MRKKAKEYGTCKLAEGPDVAGRRVTLVEDVITTGGAVRDATRALREAGAVVEVVVCAIDRSPAGENPLADVGLEVRPVLTKAQLDAARDLADHRLSAGAASSGQAAAWSAPVPPPLEADRNQREGQDHEPTSSMLSPRNGKSAQEVAEQSDR